MVSARALPVPASALLGRDADVAAASAALLGPARLVVLTGPPGVGKTRLSIAIASAVADRFADGVAWVDLTSVRQSGVVLDEIAHACGVPRTGALEDRELLVVLDNCEHLLDAAPALASLLGDHPRLRILATSRERLRVAAEHEQPVAPLPMPELDAVTDLRALAHNPAVALMLARAPAYVDLTARTALPLVEICRRLDGLPLALEFAAARLRVFTPGELAFRLEHRTGELSGSARDAPARHRDLRSAIAWSHDLLPPAERAVFRRLSVFEGSWTLDEAEAVCGGPEVSDVLAAIESLLDKSLVHRLDGEGERARFAMLVSLREYAAEELAAHDDGPATRQRHAAWFAEVARGWEETVGTGAENMIWARSAFMQGDLEAALAESRGRDPDAATWLTAALLWFWYTRGSPGHAVGLLPDPADLSEADDPRTGVLVAAGAVAFALGELDDAERQLTAGLALSEPLGDRRRTACASAFLGHVERERGHPDEAAAHYRYARATYEQLDNERGVAWAACDLGLLLTGQGELEPAEELLREALLWFEALDYPWAIAVAACGLAVVRARAGDADEGAALAVRAHRLHAEVGDVRGVAQSLEALAEVGLVRGLAATAARLLGAAAAARDRVAAHPTAAEREAASRVAATLGRQLGKAEAEREHRAGRSLHAPAVQALIDLVIGPADEDGPDAAGLTGRQLEVAALVAAGRTNRQISRELGISEKTTELHVRNAMQRLGVQNRAGIAAWMARQPS